SAPRLASRVAPPAPLRVYSLRADALARAKRRLASGDSSLRPAYDRLVREAAAALVAGPFSVMDKQRTPPSGDKHDYVSMGPYWWPDSTKPGGLPYVRRDGERNPEIRRDYDASRWGALSSAVGTLALAYYFSDDEKYAERAARLLRSAGGDGQRGAAHARGARRRAGPRGPARERAAAAAGMGWPRSRPARRAGRSPAHCGCCRRPVTGRTRGPRQPAAPASAMR